ncbi:T9SS type A sorting domain-containing protein [Flavobacteriales bacterium]|nr:T9SS type A sorting domain-containing protein [Flavobacteriales bacterium]
MKRIVFLIGVIYWSIQSLSAQIIVSNDTTRCGNYTDVLQAVGAVQDSLNGDDDYSGVIQIGFPFKFYGLTYTSLVVCDNGYITFDTTLANTSSGYSINNAIPNPVPNPFGQDPYNAIMAPWHDVLLATPFGTGNGSVFISKTGIAPNRRFIATWCAAAMFSCTDSINTFQIVLHEDTDKIETFIDTKRSCSWNSGAAVHGLVDATSTNSDIVMDPVLLQPRNFPLLWTAANEGWEFLPNGPTSYTINQIPFSVIFAGVNTWTDVNGNILGVGSTLPVNVSTSTVIYANITGECSGGNLTDSITINISGCFDISLSGTDASCSGDDATISVFPDLNLTSPPWNIELFDMSNSLVQHFPNAITNTHTFSNLFPGTYIARVTDGFGDSSQDTIIVGQSFNPLSVSSFPTDISCYEGNDASIAVWANNGLLPYDFYIDGVLSTNAYPYDSLFTDLNCGTYVISVVDDNDCMMRDTVIIDCPKFALQALAQSKVVVCYGSSDGFAVAFGSGGTPGYSYEWFDDTYTSFSLNDTAFGLSAGSYYLEVMDANGCDTFTSVQVIAPQTSLSGNPQIFGVVCKGDSTGMLVGDAQGSWAPYQYYWMSSTGDTIQDSGVRLDRDTLSGLSVGSYDLHVYDAKGCFVSYSLSVGEPATKLSIDSMVVIESIACYGDSVGKARLYASGGMPNYSYTWSDGQMTIIADELIAGYHSVVLSDDWGCEVVDSIEITENPEIESQISTVQDASCYGYTDGEAWIASVGGVPSYTYFWSNGHTGFSMPDTASGLLQGSYYVTTRDILGCEVVDSIAITEPDPLSMEASELDWIDCHGSDNGLATAAAIGGISPYTFVWDNGQWTGDTINTLTPGLHTVVVTDAKGCTASDTVFTHEPTELVIAIDDNQTVLAYCIGVNTASLTGIASGGTPGYTYEWDDNIPNPQTTATASALLAGVYMITVTDTKGCIAVDTRDIDTLTNTMDAQTTSLIQYVGGNDVSCFGEDDGEAMVMAWGAHAPYAYQWYGPNGFNSNNDSIADLEAGIYSVTVRDTNNCMVNRSINLVEPAYLYFTTLGATDESCLGACNGEIAINITGGVGSYVGIATENTTGNVITSPMNNDSIVPGICSGDYTITVTDANDCPSSVINGGVDQQTIGTSVLTTATIDPTAITHVLCNGTATGSLQVLSPNTNPNYSYSWQNVNNTVIISDTTVATNLMAGTYVLYAHYSDANNLGQNYVGCTTTDTVSVTELSALQAAATITDVDCYGNATGKLVAGQVVGGSSPYALQWNPGGMTGSVFNNLTAGTYTLTITDDNNCQEVDTFEVTQPQALTANITQNGYVLTAATPVGGVAPFSYSWREQLQGQVGTGVTYTVSNYGTYYVIVKDANDCVSQSNSFEYEEPTSIVDAERIDLSIYPNPFRDEATVDFGREVDGATISVVDVFGKQLEQYILTNTDKHILKRNNKASGVYFVEIEVEGTEKYIKKLIIE